MNTLHRVLMILALAFTAGAVQATEPVPASPEREAKAVGLLDALDAGHYDEARTDFNPTMRDALPEEALQQVWESLPDQLGAPGPRGAPEHAVYGGHPLVIVPLTYGETRLNATVAFDDSDDIAGFRITPAAAE